MEAADVQAAPVAGRKSPRLPAVARLLLPGDVGQSSSSCCDFESSRDEQCGSTTRNNPSISNSSARQLQQHRAGDAGRLSLTRFEQHAEQMLQQEQGLQVDQILDLLGMLLKRQHPEADREATLPHQQQGSTPLSAVGTTDVKRQAQNNAASPSNTALGVAAASATRQWTNTDELARHGENGTSGSNEFAADDAAAAREFLRRGRDSDGSVLRRSQEHQHEQQQQRVPNSAATGGGTTTTECRGSNSHFTIVGSNGGSQAFVEERRQQDTQQLISAGPAEWTGNSLQQQSRRMVTTAAAAGGTAAFKGAGADSMGRSNGSGSAACSVVQQPKNGPSSPSRLPLRLGPFPADPLGTTTMTGTRMRDARQQPRQQVQHLLLQQQQVQHQVRQQQLQLPHTRAQQYAMQQHYMPHPQHAQHVHQQGFGQRQLQEQQQQADKQLQRGEFDENLLNDETRQLLSRSLDVLMGDVNIQTLKDLLLRKVPGAGNGSRTNSGCNAETSYNVPTRVTAGDAVSFDAAVLSLLQQQPHQQRQQQQHQQRSQQQPEADGDVLRRNCTPESKREVQPLLEKKHHLVGENKEERTFPGSPVFPPAITNMARDLGRSPEGMDEAIYATAAGQQQQSHMRKVQQHHVSQEQQCVQQREKRTGSKASTASASSHFEGPPPCYSVGSPTKIVKDESVNTKRKAAAETVVTAGAAGNKRMGAGQRQQLQQAERKRGRHTRPSSPEDTTGRERQSHAKLSESGGGGGGNGAACGASSISTAAEQGEQEPCRAVRKARPCAGAARGGSFVESSTSDESPPPSHWDRASLLKSSASTAVEGATAAAAAGVGSLGYASSGGNSCGNEQQAATVLPQSQHQFAAASLSCRLQEQRDGEILGFLDSVAADGESAEDAVNAAAKKRLTPGGLCDTEEGVATRKGQPFEPAAAAAAGAAEVVRRGCSPLPCYRNGRRRVQEPCELALAAARLEQQGHTFTPPFYLRATTNNSNGGSRSSAVRENCKRSDAAAGGGGEKKEKDSECFNEEEGRGPALDQQQCRKGAAQGEEEQVHDNMEEEDEEMEGEHLTQQQLTLLKHIYSVLSQAEEYFSFKSALYQLHIKRHLKKCVSSLAAAAAANSASSDKDASPHTTAGENKHHRSPVHAGNTQSKAIRLFTSMPPIPINAVEQRALLSVRKHLQAGGGGALLCQGDGVAQLLMEELDELLTSLVNKLLLIIVVKFQTCFIHAPARAQLREFLVSFVFPGDMATQLLFRDHVQAVVHARIRHFRDSVGRTLRHQPPPSPPLAAASVTRSGTKRSNRIAAASSSPTSRPTEEDGDEEQDRQKKQKLYEALVDMEERENRRRVAAASPAGRPHYCSDRRKPSSAPVAPDAATHPSASLSHSAAPVAIQQDGGQGRQSSSSNNERKASPAGRSPRNKDPYRGRSLSSSDAKETTRGVGAFAGINNKAAAPGREGGRLSRAGEHGSAAAATKTAAAGVLTPAQRKGTNAGTGGPATAGGCGSGTNVRTRGGIYNRRKRGAAAASESAETRCPSASSSRYGPSVATRRGGSCPPTDTSSSGSVQSSEEATNRSQQQSLRETGSSARRGVATTATGARTEPKPTSGSATPAGRNVQYAGGGATQDLPHVYRGSNLHKPEGAQRGERTTRGGPSAEVISGRKSSNAAQPRSPSPVSRSAQENSVLQQQLLQQQQLAQPHCTSGARGEVVGRWATTAVPSGEGTEESYYERGRRSFAVGAEGGRGRSGSRISILSRGSTRESACDPLLWEQADGPRSKGCLPKASVQEAQQCVLPTPVHMTKQVVSTRGSVDSGGELASAAKAASEAAGVADGLPWTALGKGEEDEATQALAAALGVALDPNNGDSAGGAAEVWDWLAVAAGSKDEQQEKLRQTLETLLNAWTTSGTNDGRNLRGTPGGEAPGSNSRSALGASNSSNSNADGWLNLAMAEFSCAREKKGRPTQPEEVNLNQFDAASNAVHFSSAGMSGKDASLPSPSSVKNPPSEASTSFPPHEERTPPAERSAAESADADATRSPEDTENSASSRRGSVVCLPDGSLHLGRAAAAVERSATAASGTATITEGRGGGAGAVRPLRIPLPKEVNSAHGTAYESEAAALDGLTHNTIADFLLTYCKEDASAYEIAGQLKHRDTTVSTAAIDAATTVASTSQEGVQAEAYTEPRLRDEHLLSTFPHTSADKLSTNCTASNDELPALRAEAVATSHGNANTLAYSLSSLFTGSIPLPS